MAASAALTKDLIKGSLGLSNLNVNDTLLPFMRMLSSTMLAEIKSLPVPG
ncbi:MAG: hypothetical protein BWY72_00571 [Bacteroidetes bacterium ADurb.Bin416]|nr:MAG: hypothetical protein BWY72_00571 [Bacteroidetes bacterium ADurb.Bin416]